MKIIADAFGGDNAPLAVIEASVKASKELGIEMVLSGNEEIIKNTAKENNISLENIEIINADDVIDMHDDPKEVIRSKSGSSMAVGLKALAEGKGDAFISAGSTGALIMGSTFIVKRIKGIKRAAFGSCLPTLNGGQFFLMDEGANVECRPEMLLQFGVMASVYVENVVGIKNPRVALLNVGTEDTKGTELQLEAYKLLQNSNVNFIGNVEARDLMYGVADVVITDGFSGNIALKSIEGTAKAIMKMLKSAFTTNIITKIAAALVMPQLKVIKDTMDYRKIGGAPVIGVKKPVFKAHGNSDSEAFFNAIRLLKTGVENNMIEKIENVLGKEKE